MRAKLIPRMIDAGRFRGEVAPFRSGLLALQSASARVAAIVRRSKSCNLDAMENPLNTKHIAFLGDYVPRRCGIATFTADICEADRRGVSRRRNASWAR